MHREQGCKGVHPCACEQQVARKKEGRKQAERRLGRSMNYGKKKSGHEKKSSEGLAVYRYQGVANTLH